jgi:hypothetical protein
MTLKIAYRTINARAETVDKGAVVSLGFRETTLPDSQPLDFMNGAKRLNRACRSTDALELLRE